MTITKYTRRLLASCFCLTVLPGIQSAQATPPGNKVYDSLAALYVSVTPAGSNYIVDQGLKKALFNKEGNALTAFDYNGLLAGPDRRYVGVLPNNSVLLDDQGHILLTFPEIINQVDTVRKLYKSVYYDGVTAIYDGSGACLQERDYEKDEYRMGFYRYYHNGLQGVKDTLGRVILPAMFNRGLSLSPSGFAGLTGDTLYAFDTKGKLRFSTKAAGAVMLDHGVVGIKRFGLWGLMDSTGKLLTPIKYNKLEKVLSGDYIETDGVVLDHQGHEVMNREYNNVFAVMGWYEVSAPNVYGYEIRDEKFHVVIDPKQYERTDFLGNRFIEVFKGYNDEKGRLYDREARSFSKLELDTLLDMDTYLLKTKGTTDRKVLKNGRMISLPYFATIAALPERPYWLIGRSPAPEQERPEDDKDIFSRSYVLPGNIYGLMDTSLRLVLPMKYSGIRVLGNGMIVASRNEAPRTFLFNAAGKLLYTSDEAADISLQDGLPEVALQKEFLLMDTVGTIFFRSRNQPSFLYPSMTEGDGPRHSNLFLCSDSTGFSALYDRQGRQLLPALYYPVVQKVAGLYSLKKDDSIYYVNDRGRLLYNGRGFSSDDDYYIMESYALLFRDAHRKWGVIAADGSTLQPFIYDTAGIDRTAGLGYFVSRNGQYSLLDNLGRLRYPLQDWFPAKRLGDGYYQDKDQHYYRLENGNMQPLQQLPYEVWYRLLGLGSNAFVEIYDQSGLGLPPGVYNRRMQRLAPVFSGFSYYKFYDKVLITDSLQRISVIDTNGNRLMPFMERPALLVLNRDNIVVIGKDGRDRLFYEENGERKELPIKVDSAIRTTTLKQTRQYNWYTNDKTLSFSNASGTKGLAPRSGQPLIDSQVTEIQEESFYYLVKRGGKWGLVKEGTYIQPPVADSIQYDEEHFIIYKDNKKGAYYPATDKYIAPRYDEILEPASLQNGFLLVKQDGHFLIVDEQGRPLSPELDSIGRASAYLSAIIAYRQGAEASVAVADNGSLQLSLSKAIRRAGINGYYGDMVIVKEGDLYGLYSNRYLRSVLPPQYDAIDRTDRGDFLVAWKYKADKHEGIDSTVIVSADGSLLYRYKGWINPEEDENGYLKLDNAGPVTVSNGEGKVFITADQRLITVLQNNLFVVARGAKTGIVDAAGAWTLPLLDGKIDYTHYAAYGYLTLAVKSGADASRRTKYYLIDKEGRKIGKPYDSIEFTDEGKVECRSGGKVSYIAEE